MSRSRPDGSTDAPSPTSPQPTLPGLDSGTSSPGSPGGPSPSGSPGSPMTPPSGPARAPARDSRTRARGAGFSTLDIFGQHGSHSSRSAALQSSLESRLRVNLASSGSTLFSLTWNDAVTPSGRRICALRASAPRTSDSACSSWPTPTVSRGDYSYARGDHESPTLKLAGAAKLASWPTATARDWKSSASNKHGDNARPLNEVARLTAWNTPLATDEKAGGKFKRGNLTLLGQARASHWATPVSGDANGGGSPTRAQLTLHAAAAMSLQDPPPDSGTPPTGSSAETPAAVRPSPGQLNPGLSRWLQGYPIAWDFCGATGTRSSRK